MELVDTRWHCPYDCIAATHAVCSMHLRLTYLIYLISIKLTNKKEKETKKEMTFKISNIPILPISIHFAAFREKGKSEYEQQQQQDHET